MAMIHGDDPGRHLLGWQGSGVDVEIARVYAHGRCRWHWVLYDRHRRVRSGVRRSHWGAQMAGSFAALLYRARR